MLAFGGLVVEQKDKPYFKWTTDKYVVHALWSEQISKWVISTELKTSSGVIHARTELAIDENEAFSVFCSAVRDATQAEKVIADFNELKNKIHSLSAPYIFNGSILLRWLYGNHEEVRPNTTLEPRVGTQAG